MKKFFFQSTLLQSLLNELLNIVGRISYASQDPWVFSATLRENITFGREFKREHYDRVLKACALDKVSLLFNVSTYLVRLVVFFRMLKFL